MKKPLNMDKLKCNEKDKLHFVWFMIVVVCVVITYCYQKSKATDNYNKVLQIASENCNIEVVKFSVNNLLDINAQIPKVTALHYAAKGGCLEVAKFLADEGADINDTRHERWTVLHSAAYGGNLEMVRFLLEKGANPNIRGTGGKNPRDVAVLRSRHNKDKPYREIIKLLAKAEDQYKSEK